MPCERLAVATGQLQSDLYSNIVENPVAQDAARALIAQALGVEADQVGFDNYLVGFRAPAGGGMLKLQILPGGEIGYLHELDPADFAAFQQTIEPLLNDLGLALAQEETVAKINALARVTGDRWDARTGARHLKIRV